MREYLEPMLGTNGAMIAQFAITLIVVAAAILVVLWLIRVFSAGRLVGHSRARQPRLGILDALPIDQRRRLILVRRDNVEHLILIGGPSDIVVEGTIQRPGAAQRRAEAMARTAPQSRPGVAETPRAPVYAEQAEPEPAEPEPYEAPVEPPPRAEISRPEPVRAEPRPQTPRAEPRRREPPAMIEPTPPEPVLEAEPEPAVIPPPPPPMPEPDEVLVTPPPPRAADLGPPIPPAPESPPQRPARLSASFLTGNRPRTTPTLNEPPTTRRPDARDAGPAVEAPEPPEPRPEPRIPPAPAYSRSMLERDDDAIVPPPPPRSEPARAAPIIRQPIPAVEPPEAEEPLAEAEAAPPRSPLRFEPIFDVPSEEPAERPRRETAAMDVPAVEPPAEPEVIEAEAPAPEPAPQRGSPVSDLEKEMARLLGEISGSRRT